VLLGLLQKVDSLGGPFEFKKIRILIFNLFWEQLYIVKLIKCKEIPNKIYRVYNRARSMSARQGMTSTRAPTPSGRSTSKTG
jgi:hypothetical protein